MLICNNCNTVNDDDCHKCQHCQMTGNFRRQLGDNKPDDTPVLQVKIVCRNCGSDAPGEGSKCIQCRFPLARAKAGEARPELAGVKPALTIPLSEKLP